MCVYCREKDKLSVCIKTTPSCIRKKKLKLCVWTCMTWPRISESTFPSKMSSHISWKTAQLSKMVCNNVLLIVQRFEHNDLSPVFPGAVSSVKLLEASCLFIEYLKSIQFKSCVKSASRYFYCFNDFTDNSLKSVTMVMCQMGMWVDLFYMSCYSSLSTNQVECPIMTLNFTTR